MANFSPLSRDMTGTIRRKGPEITLTPREKQVYGTLWQAADVDGNGFITGTDAVPFFAKSGLSPQVLGQIWVLADADNKGVLNQQGFSIAVKLIAHAQAGKTPSAALVNVDAPLPRFEGFTSANDSPTAAATTSGSIPATMGSVDPPISQEDKTKYGSMFMSFGPIGGLLDGEKAREVFLKSKLPVEKLGQIWNLADTKQRGSLDMTDFTIAMYYIQHTMNGSIKNLPTTLPLPVLKACSPTGAGMLSSPVLSTQTLPRQATGGGVSGHLPRQLTGSIGLPSSPLAKQLTGGGQMPSSSSAFGLSPSSSLPSLDTTWDVSLEEKAKFDRFFDQLDKGRTGFLSGEEAGKFFMNSRLPETILAQIWDLADITKSGSLSKDEFAVAMYLINRKNASGIPIPDVLPPTLIPPSLRTRSMLTSGFSEPLRSMANPPSSHARRQSFDLLGDGPVASHSTGPSSTVDKETEELQSKITAATGELASLQNQFNNMSQTTGDLQAKRQLLEQQLSSLSAQKHEISIRLNQIKTLHENETKTIKDLQNTIASLQPQTIKLREELITSERELAIARNNKDEYLLSVARDKEESEQIKTKLKQNQDETIRLRQELDAMKKDTTRQKGLLEINRRQLAASESEKQKLKDEIEGFGLEHQRQSSSSSTTSSQAPPPPAPRGSRKEPPPPPASRGSNFAKASPEMEDAFGIPQALRSPTGSVHEVPKAPSITSVSRQSTGTSPFETISRQTTGTSPFEQIARQDTGMSAKAASIKSNSGATGFLEPGHSSSIDAAGLWSPSTHAAHNAAAGGIEFTKSPEPLEPSSAFEPSSNLLASTASTVPLPTSPPTSRPADPFSSMAFPAMDSAPPAATKVDFDAAFQGFSGTTSSSKPSDSMSDVKSAEAFAEAFPEIESITSPSASGKRVSAFGFDDDFQASLPSAAAVTTEAPSAASATVSKRTIKEEDDEFPPIVQKKLQDDSDSSDDEEAFVQASSHIPTPDLAAVTSNQPKLESTSAVVAPLTTATPSPNPVTSAPTSSAPRKLTTADFEEFETKLGGSDGFGADDFDSAFRGVELSSASKAPPSSSGHNTGEAKKDAFDMDFEFEDAFGSSSAKPAAPAGDTSFGGMDFGTGSSPFGQSHQPPSKPIDLDEAFGAFGGNSGAGASSSTAVATGFDGFEDGFGTTSTPAAPAGSSDQPNKDVPAPAAATAAASTISPPSSGPPPAVELQGVDELMSMGFSRQQANDALSRYDTVERAANFLLEGGVN